MGMDISFHPVDVAFIHEHILPFVRGERDIGDLVAQAVRLAKVRYRVNAWGLGLLRLDQAMHEMQRKALAKTVPGGGKRGWLTRLFSRRSSNPAEDNPPATIGVPGFDRQIHVWGRPFFITHDDPAEISRAIDTYMAAEYHTVDDIAREMLVRLDHGRESAFAAAPEPVRASLRLLEPTLVDHVRPKRDDPCPSDEDLAKEIRTDLDVFRDAYAAIPSGRKVSTPDGTRHDPRELFATQFPLAVLQFAAHFRPGWMARGDGWPSYLLSQAGVSPSGLFETPAELFQPLLAEIPEIGRHLNATLLGHYRLGGYSPASRVAQLRETFEKLAGGAGSGPAPHSDAPSSLYLRLIHEALFDAQLRGLAFVEATEVYSVPLGILN